MDTERPWAKYTTKDVNIDKHRIKKELCHDREAWRAAKN